MDFLTVEFVWGWLSAAAKYSLVEKIIVFLVVWYFVRKTISKHFRSIENGLAVIAQTVRELQFSLEEIEDSHVKRIEKLEQGVRDLTIKVHGAETKEDPKWKP